MATRVGYTGGKRANPTYRSMADHTEATQVDFDPQVVSYDELLAIIWRSHNPFGNKGSCQYKSAIWYDPASPSQQASVEASAAALSKAKGGLKVQTCLEPLGPFYLAEEYHQKYIAKQSGGRNGFY